MVVGEQPFHTHQSRVQADLQQPAVELLLALRGIAQVERRIRDQVGSMEVPAPGMGVSPCGFINSSMEEPATKSRLGAAA